MADGQHTDEQVLADPGEFTVEQVTTVLARSSDSEVQAAKDVEAAGQNRKGIVEWQRPAAATGSAQSADSTDSTEFPLERLLGPDGPEILGHPAHVIAGGLHGIEASALTRRDASQRIEAWLEREVPLG